MLGDIETRLQAAGQNVTVGGIKHGLIAKAMSGGEAGWSGSIAKTRNSYKLHERGEEQLAKFFIVQQFFSEQDVAAALETVKKKTRTCRVTNWRRRSWKSFAGRTRTSSTVISSLIDRTKFAYVPLEYYDVDRQMAPDVAGKSDARPSVVPFDLISRTIMVACCNPFDAAGREAVQQSLDYTVTWYLARPGAIIESAAGHLPAR